MKSVTFLKAWSCYFPGDSAQFETELADKLIKAEVAKAYEGGPDADDKKKAGKF